MDSVHTANSKCNSSYLVDLHCHTRYSYDNLLDPEDLLQRASDLGIHGVGIVEHHSYEASEPVERFFETYGVHIFRGVELSTDRGHVLVFGVRNDRWNRWGRNNYLPFAEVLEHLSRIGAVCIPAHPYRSHSSDGIGDDIYQWNGWAAVETHNGLNTSSDNHHAAETADRLHLPTTGGSDCHKPDQVGRCVTAFDNPIGNLDDLITEIRHGRCRGLINPYFNGKPL